MTEFFVQLVDSWKLNRPPLSVQIIIANLGFTVLLFACAPEPKSFTNRLKNASSPYLREHGDNPVDWYEWSAEALTKAKNENKPLLISIGYASCHWCHVMEEESFMDTAVANIMNRYFIAIKIDREERPDLDQIYINAAQLISGNAGWPLNAFALPDGKPFFVSTYAPKEQWITSLRQIAQAYERDPRAIEQRAQLVTEGVKNSFALTSPPPTNDSSDQGSYTSVFDSWEKFFDLSDGGLKGAPKFPMPVIWESVLQHYYLTGNKRALDAALTTLTKMAKGGIFDQVGGGFARYSTDSLWKIPHFEKMLYDNGQLVSLYSHAHQITANADYERVIHKTLNFIATEMMSPEGGFYSSVNADSEGEEGKFYVWTKSEIEKVLDGKTSSLIMEYYNITEGGNWDDGKNILFTQHNDDKFAAKRGMTRAQWVGILGKAEEALLKARSMRIRPSLDDKILTAWNAIMLNGFVDAYFATGEKSYLSIAVKNAEFLAKEMIQSDGRVSRSFVAGKASIDGFLEDYAFLAAAYVHLYEATFDRQWLDKSRTVIDYAINHFRDASTGLFFYTSDLSEKLVARTVEIEDNVMPSSNSACASVLFRLAAYFDQNEYREIAEGLLKRVPLQIMRQSPSYANWISIREFVAFKPFELAVMGPDAIKVSNEIYGHYLPTTILMGGVEENLPLLEHKLVNGQTIIYVCRDKVCKLPTKSVTEALSQLGNRSMDVNQ